MKKGTLTAIIVILLAAIIVLVCGIGSSWFTNGDIATWFNSWGKGTEQEQPADEERGEETGEEQEQGGMLIEENESSGAVLAMSVITEEQYADYGVSEEAESAQLLTATLDPVDAPYTTATWSVAWANAESEWASGKTVTDYVTVSATETNALSAVVENLQAFGEQIIITLSVTGAGTVSATCTVDYAQRINAVSLFFGNERILQSPYVLGDSYSSQFGIESSLEYEQYPRGGEMDVFYSTSDTYTLADEFTVTCTISSPVAIGSQLWGEYGDVSFYYPEGSPDSLYIFNNYNGGVAENGLYFSLAWFAENLGLSWIMGGSHGYAATGEIFDEGEGRTAAYYADLFNSLSENVPLCVIDFSIDGTYSSYEKHVTVYLSVANEYVASLGSVSLDEEQIIF